MQITNQNNFGSIAYPSKSYPNATVKSGGCGACAALMMVENLTNIRYKMQDWINWVLSTGARVNGGTYMPTLVTAMVERFGFNVTATSDETALKNHLKNGGMAIANVGGSRNGWSGLFSSSGHFIAVLDILGDDRFVIADPAFTKSRYSSAFRRSRVQVDGDLVYVNAQNLHLDTLTRTPNYYLFTAPSKTAESGENMVRYQTYDALPEWGKPAVKQLMDEGRLKGDGKGNIDLSEDMLRILVMKHDKIYNWVAELPEYAQPVIKGLVDEGAIKNEDGNLGLTLEAIRTLVIDERSLA